MAAAKRKRTLSFYSWQLMRPATNALGQTTEEHSRITPANVVAHCRHLASEGVHRSDCASTYRFPASRPGRTNKRIFLEVSGEAE